MIEKSQKEIFLISFPRNLHMTLIISKLTQANRLKQVQTKDNLSIDAVIMYFPFRSEAIFEAFQNN
jgi:hypothetical protein